MFFNLAVVPGQDDFCFGCERGRCFELAYFLTLRGDASETWLVVDVWHYASSLLRRYDIYDY